MKRRDFLKQSGFALGGLTLSSLFFGCSTKTAGHSSRPNIIFILADDMGYGDIQAFNTA